VDEQRGARRPERRVHLSEAAELLGVSKDAVRMRVKRGTLRSEKGRDGRVYVWVNVNPDGDQSTVHPEPQVEVYRELIDELRDRVRSLEEANRENRRIIAALTARIPEIEAPADTASEAPQAPTEATEQPGRIGAQPAVEGAQEPAEPRSWWRRVFGG
jgi:excisionase family DNA binding protein